MSVGQSSRSLDKSSSSPRPPSTTSTRAKRTSVVLSRPKRTNVFRLLSSPRPKTSVRGPTADTVNSRSTDSGESGVHRPTAADRAIGARENVGVRPGRTAARPRSGAPLRGGVWGNARKGTARRIIFTLSGCTTRTARRFVELGKNGIGTLWSGWGRTEFLKRFGRAGQVYMIWSFTLSRNFVPGDDRRTSSRGRGGLLQTIRSWFPCTEIAKNGRCLSTSS